MLSTRIWVIINVHTLSEWLLGSMCAPLEHSTTRSCDRMCALLNTDTYLTQMWMFVSQLDYLQYM